jgi:hypothetical protein
MWHEMEKVKIITFISYERQGEQPPIIMHISKLHNVHMYVCIGNMHQSIHPDFHPTIEYYAYVKIWYNFEAKDRYQ